MICADKLVRLHAVSFVCWQLESQPLTLCRPLSGFVWTCVVHMKDKLRITTYLLYVCIVALPK